MKPAPPLGPQVVVDEEELDDKATTTAATAAAATATVVDTAAAAPAAPEAAAVEPAAPAELLAPAAEDCANDGTAKNVTNKIDDNNLKIRIKLTPVSLANVVIHQ